MTSKNSTKKNALLNEQVTFIQNAIPGLEAGKYSLSISQTLFDCENERIDKGGLDADYSFAVLGDRFAFGKPAEVVYSVFPPDSSDGKYETSLPHVVLTQKTLPWSRSPTTHIPTPNAVGDVATWLGVLTFDEHDVKTNPQLSLDPIPGVIGDLFHTGAYPKSSLGKDDHSYFDGAIDDSVLEPGETFESPIEYLDIPLLLFWQVAPTIADLNLTAHVREVSLVQKPTMPGVSDLGEPVGSFSIVFGNRLARADVTTRAYLVSLEGLGSFLPTSEDGGAPTGTKFKGSETLRLAVLKNWSYRATGQPATFVDDVEALNSRYVDSKGQPITTMHLPYGGTDTLVKGALEMGYVPLDTDMRTGGKTVSWYRGPLAPYADKTTCPELPISSPDAAMSFDPTSGMFDMSYAAAWTIGRMVALQDSGFSVSLYQWKKSIHQGVASVVEAEVLLEKLNGLEMMQLPKGVTARGARPLETVFHHMIQSLTRRSCDGPQTQD